jgi:hypothetical protein
MRKELPRCKRKRLNFLKYGTYYMYFVDGKPKVARDPATIPVGVDFVKFMF